MKSTDLGSMLDLGKKEIRKVSKGILRKTAFVFFVGSVKHF
jgi:hypothetical protein